MQIRRGGRLDVRHRKAIGELLLKVVVEIRSEFGRKVIGIVRLVETGSSPGIKSAECASGGVMHHPCNGNRCDPFYRRRSAW